MRSTIEEPESTKSLIHPRYNRGRMKVILTTGIGRSEKENIPEKLAKRKSRAMAKEIKKLLT